MPKARINTLESPTRASMQPCFVPMRTCAELCRAHKKTTLIAKRE